MISSSLAEIDKHKLSELINPTAFSVELNKGSIRDIHLRMDTRTVTQRSLLKPTSYEM
jgi:hypothetical protein